MMIWVRIGILCLIPPAWIVGASWLYCAMKGNVQRFEFPYNQWIIAAPWWLYDYRTTASVVGGAAVPTIIAVMICIALIRFRRKAGDQQRALYGKSDWANRKEMDDAGIKHNKVAF